jgi:pimeloyl-ACP methyl ester carboxylesterase
LIESQWLKINDKSIHYVTAGSGFPLILLHGGANDWREWDKNIDILSRHYHVIAPDIIGFGKSDRLNGVYRVKDFVDFMAGMASELSIEKMHLAGHSLGGMIGLEYACRYPQKVVKLIPVAPYGLGKLSPRGLMIGAAFYWARRLLMRRNPYPSLDLDYSKAGFERFLENLKGLDVPAMVVWGQKDPYLPVHQAYLAHSVLPNSKFEVMLGCGHAPQKSDSDRFNQLVIDFLGDGKVD